MCYWELQARVNFSSGYILQSKWFIFRLFFEWNVWLTLNSVSGAPSRISLANITAVRKSGIWKLDLHVVFQTFNTLLLLYSAIPENETTHLVETKVFVIWNRPHNNPNKALDGLFLKYRDQKTWFKQHFQI